MNKLATEEMTACPSCSDLTFEIGPCFRCSSKTKARLDMLHDTKPFDLPTAFNKGFEAARIGLMETMLMKDILLALQGYRETLIDITRGRVGYCGDHSIYSPQLRVDRTNGKLEFLKDVLERLDRTDPAAGAAFNEIARDTISDAATVMVASGILASDQLTNETKVEVLKKMAAAA